MGNYCISFLGSEFNSASLLLSGDDTALLVVLEGNPKDVTHRDALFPVIGLALGAIKCDESHIHTLQGAMRNAISNELAKSSGPVRSAQYMSVYLEKSEAIIEHAGNIKAHLVEGGEVKRTTRSHNWVEDKSEAERQDQGCRAPERLMQTWLTRCLGSGSEPEPEITRWPMTEGDTLLVCSESFHRHRDPSDYIAETARVSGMDRLQAFVAAIRRS